MIAYAIRKIKVGNGNGNFSLVDAEQKVKVGNGNS